MCCFSRPVQSVSNTRIFARDAEHGRQLLAYSMSLSASDDLAMILPLPVPSGSSENAVRFIDLAGYPDLFDDLKSGFPEPPQPRSMQSKGPVAAAAQAPPLVVHSVGSFDASFVPSIKDLSRLDPRFRLPDGVWEKLPQYKSYGFGVFKLKKNADVVHPMAFEFPRADPTHLFFPTVHIHDGTVHAEAYFDHALYCQMGLNPTRVAGWRESPAAADSFMNVDKSKGLIHPHEHCYLKKLVGSLKNADTHV